MTTYIHITFEEMLDTLASARDEGFARRTSVVRFGFVFGYTWDAFLDKLRFIS